MHASTPLSRGVVRAICPPRTQQSTWRCALSQKEAGPLGKQLVRLHQWLSVL